ncbi:MAG: hypothetical protein LBP81_01100 [Treponema sp.]|jgi:hypothetical protein|nr:hypothetical protein [Treponema sp.]
MKRKLFNNAVVCVGLTLFSLMGCATTEVNPEGSLVITIGDVLPPPASGNSQIADGSYVCSRAEILRLPSLQDQIFGGERITYNNTKYVKPGKSGTKSVAIRISSGKVTEIMAVQQGKGETAKTYATATVYYSVETPVWIPSSADFDKASDFNEAKSMLH